MQVFGLIHKNKWFDKQKRRKKTPGKSSNEKKKTT